MVQPVSENNCPARAHIHLPHSHISHTAPALHTSTRYAHYYLHCLQYLPYESSYTRSSPSAYPYQTCRPLPHTVPSTPLPQALPMSNSPPVSLSQTDHHTIRSSDLNSSPAIHCSSYTMSLSHNNIPASLSG